MTMDAQALRDANKAKAHRLANASSGRVDCSDWKPSTPAMGGTQTGERPVSKQMLATGGKAMTPDNYQNRDMKEANEEREGKKFTGGFKAGGKIARKSGGKVGKTNINIIIAPSQPQQAVPSAPPPMPMPPRPMMPPAPAMAPQGMPQGMPPQGMPMMRKDGGKVYDGGAGGGKGRLEKARNYGLKPA